MRFLSCIIIHCYTFLLSLPDYGNTIQVIDALPERRIEVKKIVEFYLTHFEIKNQEVVIFMSPEMPDNYKAYIVAAFRDKHGQLGFTQVNVDNRLKGNKLAKVIGHEIYHIKQMVDKKLYFEDNRSIVKWKGKSFKNIGRIPFEQRPWEKECLQRELRFANAYSKFRKDSLKYADMKGQEKKEVVSTEGQIIRMFPDQIPSDWNLQINR